MIGELRIYYITGELAGTDSAGRMQIKHVTNQAQVATNAIRAADKELAVVAQAHGLDNAHWIGTPRVREGGPVAKESFDLDGQDF